MQGRTPFPRAVLRAAAKAGTGTKAEAGVKAGPGAGNAAGMIEGHVDQVARGLVLGWARGARNSRPCRVAVLLDGVVLGEAVAGLFRRDLLQAGIGHGHHAFAARLRVALPAGEHALRLRGADGGTAGEGTIGEGTVAVPEPETRRPLTVEDLLARGDRWRAEDVAGRIDCLALEANLLRMGATRFVECCYRFALGRWPHAHESAPPAGALQAGTLAPDALMRTMLASPERAGIDEPPPSPYDPSFPFVLD